MFRYVATLSASEEQALVSARLAARLHAAQWDEPMQAAGIRVFQRGARPGALETHVLPEAAGVIIGRTFARSADVLDATPAPPWRANATETAAILASRGRWLIDHCWGNYVAILRSPDTNCISIVKDPSGTLPCFVTATAGVLLIFSIPDDLVRLRLCRFTINHNYLREGVLHGADGRHRPLSEVDEIQRGECVDFHIKDARAYARQYFWNPCAFVSDDRIDDPGHAAKVMRATVRHCTSTLATLDSRIVHRLSGGLDSSIIAGCLRDAPSRPHVCCYTYFVPGAPSDERPWARLVAAHLQVEHLEVPMTPKNVDLRRALDMPLLVQPASIRMYTLRSTIEPVIAHDARASVVFHGGGGDAVFGAEATRYAAWDYLRRRGFDRELLRIAAQVALRTRQSTWSVLWGALASTSIDPIESEMPEMSHLVSRDVLMASAARKMFVHAWFQGHAHIPWAIVWRLGALLGPPQFYEAPIIEDVPEVISPLYAQPVIETLLRIPLYRLFEGGRDRGLARRAFAHEVPAPILNRLWKDRAPGFSEQVVFRNRLFLRETFLDGVLVREGLLDRQAIEDTFANVPLRRQALPAEIFRQFELEVWARAWGMQ